MAFGEKYVPLQGVNTDLSPSLMPNTLATFIKNLVYSITDTSEGKQGVGTDTGVFKTMQSNAQYIEGFELPAGENTSIGALSSRETKQVFVMVHNSEGDHTIYVLDGNSQTISIIDQGAHLNFQLNPEHFFHVGSATLWVLYVSDPDTGLKKRKTYLFITDNYNPQRFYAVEDAIATGGFDPELFPYFAGDYNHEVFINAGVAPPTDCIEIKEVPVTEESQQMNNKLLFNTWQFRRRGIDMWGRPSDYSIISDLYIPGINDCLSQSANIPRCVDLIFDAPTPNIDKIEIAYRNCNSEQWYTADTLDLYNGSPMGEWWTRERNSEINYDAGTGKITYRFCADRECLPISQDITSRLFNPIPNKSVSVSSVGKTNAYSNNEYGFNPLSNDLLNKISITVESPESVDQEPRNITVYVPIYNPYRDNYQQVFKDGTLGYSFGDNNAGHGGARAYKQYFTNINQQGFNGYLVGGPSAISTQVYLSSTGEIIDDTEHDGINLSQLIYHDGGYTMQKFVFTNVPAGIYVFRLSSHLSDPDSDVDYRKTSTTILGVCPLDLGRFIPNTRSIKKTHELIIDVCDDDYNTLDSGEMMVIFDLAAFSKQGFGSNYRSIAYCGYVTESFSDDGVNIPMELVGLNEFSPTGITDHNGFYFQSVFVPDNIHGMDGEFTFINKCIPVTAKRKFTTQNIVFEDLAIDSIDGNRYADFSTTPCNRVLIKGKLTLKDTNIGIPGVTVVLTRGSYDITDSDGNFTIIAHDDGTENPRKDKLIVTNGSCRYFKEGEVCIDAKEITIYRCNVCTGERQLDVGEDFLVSNFLKRGLLSGGTYPVGVAGKDFIDRSQFVQDLGYINVPTTQQTKTFAPSRIKVTIPPDAVFPEGLEELVFSVGEETTIQNYVTWIVDSFQLIDNTGEINTTNPTQIKIFYSSLIEYNKQNNFNTTVEWGFIQEGNEDMPFTNDKVEFLVNGDGKFFDKAITAQVKYAKDGQYFLINYTDSLKDLKPNAFIRLVRPKDCITAEPMYEICYPVKLVNGKPTETEFYLNPYDTYYINREIPVPTLQEGSDEPTFVNEKRIFAYPFEHNSPSDFWGQGCKNTGRVNVKNPYEAILYKGNEIALTGSFSDSGFINYLSVFDESQKFSYDESLLGYIVSIIPQIGKILIIGNLNNCVVGVNDNVMRIDNAGNVVVPSAAQRFGQPYGKVGGNYGCLMIDKNSIYEYEGLVHWVDSNKACVVQHNYADAANISELSCDGYFRAKVKSVQSYNNSHDLKRYFVGCVSHINKEYLITDKIIGSSNYINALRYKDPTIEETIAFSVITKALKGWYSFLSEFYSELEGEANDNQLFSFKNGIPYYHYSTSVNAGYGTFFGVPVDRVIEIVVNTDNLKKKKMLSTSVYSHNLYFSDNVETESGQLSWIPVEYWNQADYFWSAPFLCSERTLADPNLPLATGANKLTDGDNLYGLWVRVRYVGLPSENAVYTELTGITVDVFPEQKTSV